MGITLWWLSIKMFKLFTGFKACDLEAAPEHSGVDLQLQQSTMQNGEAPYPVTNWPNQTSAYTGGPYYNEGFQGPLKGGATIPPPQPCVVRVVTPADLEVAAKIKDYWFTNIRYMICCCLPLGIIALIKSNECKQAKRVGDVQRAMALSNEARKWGIITAVFGLIIVIGSTTFCAVYFSPVLH